MKIYNQKEQKCPLVQAKLLLANNKKCSRQQKIIYIYIFFLRPTILVKLFINCSRLEEEKNSTYFVKYQGIKETAFH